MSDVSHCKAFMKCSQIFFAEIRKMLLDQRAQYIDASSILRANFRRRPVACAQAAVLLYAAECVCDPRNETRLEFAEFGAQKRD
jgi:hypothetical protein